MFEVEQRITEDALKDCPCGSKGTVKRLIQPVAVSFKGSGFHINDYKAPSAPPSEGKSEAPAEKAEAKPEAKPATETPVASTESKAPAAAPAERTSKD